MSNIYEGQAWRLRLDTGIDLTGATTIHIDYKNDDGRGEFTATVDGTHLYYDFETDEITEGKWQFQTHVVIAGLDYVGDPFTVVVKPRLVPLS